jgi:hypothetical protein
MFYLFLFVFIVVFGYLIYRLIGYDGCFVLQTIKLDDLIVEIVDEGCKEGLPHTTGPQTVRMTQRDWDGPRRDAILRHERVHCDQKGARGGEWHEFYDRAWDYKCLTAPPAGIPAEYIARRRPNPDTDAAPYAVWRGRYVFFSVFGEDKTLSGAPVLIWDLERGRAYDGIPADWRAEFCGTGACPAQYEHPHEISAEYITYGSSRAPAAMKLFAWHK